MFKNNLTLGIFHLIRKASFKKKFKINKIPDEICDIFSINKNKAEILKFFEINKIYKKNLLQIADDFVNKKVTIYQKKINLPDYTVDKQNINNLIHETHLKDTRFFWEVYRGKYLFSVGLSYFLTRNEAYALSLIDFITQWKKYSPAVQKNIPYNGMEAALKLINLSWLDCFLKHSKHYNEKIRKILIYSLVFHAEYTYRNYDISFYGLESNHSLSCSVGLLFTSLLFPNYVKSKRWFKFGVNTLKRALIKQFSRDGVNFESSVQYHRFTFEMLIFLLAAFYASSTKVSTFFEDSIKKIGVALESLSHRNDYIARIGDSDGGKFFYDTGTIDEFNRLDYLKWFRNDDHPDCYETLLFLNIARMKKFLSKSNCKFRIGNYLSYKDSDISLIISANEIGTSGKGNHQHNDFLSFELYGQYPFIVDCWSYCYTGDKELRNKDRKTISHNTIEIDGRDIVEFDYRKLFEMIGNIHVKLEEILDDDKAWMTSIKHDGYKNLKAGRQIHSRKFNYSKKNRVLKITDILSGKGKHVAKLNFHIPQKYWRLEETREKLIFKNKEEEFILMNDVGNFTVAEGSISEYFLNSIASYYVSIEKSYIDELKIESTVIYNPA